MNIKFYRQQYHLLKAQRSRDGQQMYEIKTEIMSEKKR